MLDAIINVLFVDFYGRCIAITSYDFLYLCLFMLCTIFMRLFMCSLQSEAWTCELMDEN